MQTVYFLDIDDCLIETSQLDTAELIALESSLSDLGIKKAKAITKEFSKNFHRLYDHHQGKHLSKLELQKLDQYFKDLKLLERNIIKKYGQIKKWSREVCLYISAAKFGVRLNSGEIEKATIELWKAITDHNPFYPDALIFLKSLIVNRKSFYLISGSDCRLVYDQKNNLFNYNPEYSRKLKLKRLQKFMDIGVKSENIFIGDPYDKPNPWVFKQALLKAKKDIGTFTSVMIGDSVNNDLLPAFEAGIKNLKLINRHHKHVKFDSSLKIKEIFDFSEVST